MKNHVIILASGTGSRFRDDKPKQFVKIAGKTVVEHTIDVFEKIPEISDITIVITPEYYEFMEHILLNSNYKKIKALLYGGSTRSESSYIGVMSVNDDDSNVIIHDCARPFISARVVENCIEALQNHDAIDVAIVSTDTIIEVDDSGYIKSIPKRSTLRRGQTPQCFKTSLIKNAHNLAMRDKNSEFTDDCGLVIKYNLAPVYVVEGDEKNIKITYPQDIYLADKIFQVNSIQISNDENLENLKGKNIVIFGASRGIGNSIAKIAQSYGANVFGFSLSSGVNVQNYDDVVNAIKDIGTIDFVVNTAGILNISKLEARPIESIKNEINTNYIGSINVIKACTAHLKQTKGSLLLFTSSSYTRGRSLYATYSSSKAAIVNLTQAMSEEFFNDGIKINVINPERTATEMRLKNFGKEPEGSLLHPDRVAESSLKVLLSNLTGQIIDVRRN